MGVHGSAFFLCKYVITEEDAIPIPLAILLVASVATVGSLIFGRPIWLYFEGRKKEAVPLLIKTIPLTFVWAVLALLSNIRI